MKYKTFHFPSIDSTNTWILQNTHLFPRDAITLVYADKQSGGRGRYKNRWQSPNCGNLYATFGVFIPTDQGVQPNLAQLMALAAVAAIEKMGLCAAIKWPNDLLINQKKIAGILTETVIDKKYIFHAIGIGVNINMPLSELVKIDRPATSLSQELSDKPINPAEFLEALKALFARFLDTFLQEGFAPYFPAFKAKLCHQKNQKLSFHENGHLWEGRFQSVNPDGTLNLQLESGELKRFYAGEII